jgi:ketosteroid isomerase-like protein
MTHAQLQAWLDRYVAAWRSNDAATIADLFAEDVTYRYYAWARDEGVVHGRDALVASWLDDPDEPDSWEAHYEPFAIEGDRAVATGTSRYFARGAEPERMFWNCYLMRFTDDGRCVEFTEYYMRQPADESGSQATE